MAAAAETYICPPELEIYGRSLSTIRRLGVFATDKAIAEVLGSPEADQARVEFYTSVEEGFGTDVELGGGLEVRDFDIRAIIDGKVMSKNRKTAISVLTESGLKRAFKKVNIEKDSHFMPQLIRSKWDHENALIVDEMVNGETEYNTRIVVSPFPEEAAKQSGNAYWQGIGYVPHLKRGFVQLYHATEKGLVAGSLSFDGSDKARLREVFGRYGIAIPETEETDSWLQYAITGTFSEEEAKILALEIADEAADPNYEKTANTVEVTSEHRTIMDMVFNESYVHACESLVRGYQTPPVRQLIGLLAQKVKHFNDRYQKALYEMRANERRFNDDDMVVVHELLVYSTIEMIRALHLKEIKLGDGSNYRETHIDAVYLQSLSPVAFQNALSGFGAEGARNNRTYSACGLSIAPGKEASSGNPQETYGGNDVEEDATNKEIMKCVNCPKCRTYHEELKPKNGKYTCKNKKCGYSVKA